VGRIHPGFRREADKVRPKAEGGVLWQLEDDCMDCGERYMSLCIAPNRS